MNPRLIAITFLIVLAACDQKAQRSTAEQVTPKSGPAAALQKETTSVYQDAVIHLNRRAADHDRDAGRKPAQVLAFFGIEPGMTVLDLFSGGGYYSELLSYIVGTEGRVVAHSNEAYVNFVGEEFQERYADGRLTNVEILMAENNELELPAETFDAVTLMM
jgi:predicted methyltransferase